MRTIIRTLAGTAVAVLAAASAAQAHNADPHYLTVVRTIAPQTPGVTVDVLNRSDQLSLRNRSGKDVLIEGYDGEPYARVMRDGTVYVNTDSPAYYLNQDRFAQTQPPAGVTKDSPPKWQELDKTGRFDWHDHRMHWMSKTPPTQVAGAKAKMKIFDWSVPVKIDGTPGKIAGTLYWTPLSGSSAAIVPIIAVTVIACALLAVVGVRRRRRLDGDEPPAGTATGEAW